MATNMSSLPSFAYSQLAAREIRLLIPDSSTPENGCSWLLKTVSLDSDTHFDALSYAWGPQAETFSIACNQRQLQVHHNLYNALPYLARRYRAGSSAARPYWIDAICINQADEEEKISQIRLMNAVYQQASKVWVWLGCAQTQEQQNLIPRAIELLPLLVKEQARYRQSSTPQRFETAHELAYLGRDGWEAILHLMRNPYFRRVWIMQEIALAKEIMFLCGDHEIDAQLMEKAVFDSWSLRNWLIYDSNGELMRVQAPSHDDNIVFMIRHIVQGDSTHSHAGGNAHQTIRIANLLDDQTCFAPQDRILGMLGMVQEEFGHASADLHSYTSIPDLYTRFSTLMLDTSGPHKTDLHWWYYLSMAFNLKRLDGLPSWVPDLHHNDATSKRQPYESIMSIRALNTHAWRASTKPSTVHKGPGGDEIVLRGKLLDQIVLVHPEVPHFPDASEPGYGDGMTWLAVLAACIRWEAQLAAAVLQNPHHASTTAHRVPEDTYWRTLLADTHTTPHSRTTWLEFRAAGAHLLTLVPALTALKACVQTPLPSPPFPPLTLHQLHRNRPLAPPRLDHQRARPRRPGAFPHARGPRDGVRGCAVLHAGPSVF